MRRAGIGGLLFMDGAMGNPVGPHRFMSDSWRAMFKHMVAEADRLGLEINLNNDPGWAGSGGPWIKPEQASQQVVMSETIVQGPGAFRRRVAAAADDRQLLSRHRRAGLSRARGRRRRPVPPHRELQLDQIVCRRPGFRRLRALAARDSHQSPLAGRSRVAVHRVGQGARHQRPDGRAGPSEMGRPGRPLARAADRPHDRRRRHPIGAGRGQRLGMRQTEQGRHRDAVQRAWSAKLLADVGPLAGKTIVSTHIDSWEAGSGNWTDGFREEFRRRRGYDLLPYLPTLNGLVVDSLEVSERFLWDLRETVCEMLLENYAGHLKELAHRKGLRLSIEGYDGTCDDLRLIGRADEPMCEFWQRGCYTGMPLCDIVDEVSSAAHVYGRRIVAAEAFTNWHGDFLDHPATLKPLGDWAFCAGREPLSASANGSCSPGPIACRASRSSSSEPCSTAR